MANKITTWTPVDPPFRRAKQKVFLETAVTGQFIYQLGEGMLRKSSAQVKPKDISSKAFQKKLRFVEQCLLKYRQLTGMGRGISAVQVGIQECFTIIYMPENKSGFMIMINPVIMKRSEKKLRYPEICMSAHPLVAPVVQSEWVEVEYYDELGDKQYWAQKSNTKQGRIYNRVLQHEIDHLNGIINIDRVAAKDIIFALDPDFYEQATFEEII